MFKIVAALFISALFPIWGVTEKEAAALFRPEVSCESLKDPLPPLGGKPATDDNRKTFVWTGGGSGGMGNTFVGFLTSYYDAMRKEGR